MRQVRSSVPACRYSLEGVSSGFVGGSACNFQVSVCSLAEHERVALYLASRAGGLHGLHIMCGGLSCEKQERGQAQGYQYAVPAAVARSRSQKLGLFSKSAGSQSQRIESRIGQRRAIVSTVV